MMGVLREIIAESNTWVRGLLIFWGFIIFVLAFYIPVFDFGFDGVVLWFVYSIFLLFALGGITFALRYFLHKYDDDAH